jgi:CRP-like cAMP-binding protein
MAIDALVKPFLTLDLFRGLKPLQITEIVRRADRIVYRPGDVIIRENEEGDAAIVLVAGDAVKLSGRFNDPAEALPAGTLLGEMAMLIQTQHSTTVVARSSVRALRIARSELHHLMVDDPKIADHFVQKISARLSAVAEELRAIDRSVASRTGPVAQFVTAAPPSAVLPALH